MVSIKWIRQNDHLVQYLALSNGSHLKIRIFLSKQLHSPRSHILQRILHVYYRSQWLFHLCLSQTKHNIVTDPTPHTKAFHKLNADFAKFLFILDLLYSEEANNQQHFHAVLNNLFLQKLWVALQLTPGTRQIFFRLWGCIFISLRLLQRDSTFSTTNPLNYWTLPLFIWLC